MRAALWIVAAVATLASAPLARAETRDVPEAASELAAARHWRLETGRGAVHVWTPAGYTRKTAATIVYVHGYHMDVDEAWAHHDLAGQFETSGLNALFIAPEAPRNKYMGVVWLSLHELLRVVEQGVGERLPGGRLVAVAYSGGHRTLDYWLPNTRLDAIVLLDAMYGDFYGYARWLRSKPRRKLVTIGDDTIRATDRFHRLMPPKVKVEDFEQLPDKFAAARKARTVYLRSTLGHWNLMDTGLVLPSVLGLVADEL